MQIATKSELTDISQFTGAAYAGMDFCEEIKLGLPVVARPELPKLQFHDDTSEETVRAEVSKWNKMLAGNYSGAGYFGPSQEAEHLLNNHVYVMFADDVFYDEFARDTSLEEVISELPSF